jgi:hypothetical protein
VRGRITERQLPLAEKSFPGIGRMYRGLEDKSLTFLQLVWMYEEAREKRQAPPRRRMAVAARG